MFEQALQAGELDVAYGNPYHAVMARRWQGYEPVLRDSSERLSGILVVAGITFTALSLSERVVRVIGANGMNAMSKVMGFLILCIGIQFVVNGVLGGKV